MVYAFIVSIFIITSSLKASASDCKSFYKSPLVKKISKLIQTAPSVWQGYVPQNHKIALTNIKDYPKCAVVIENKKITHFKNTESISITNGYYSFLPAPGSNENAGLTILLEQKGILSKTNPFDLTLISLHSTLSESQLNKLPGKSLGLISNVIFHEVFHIKGQIFSPSWPKWILDTATADNRDKFTQLCQKDQSASIEREIELLIETLKNEQNKTIFSTKLKQFIDLREARYSKISADCVTQENAFEMLEGSAEYVGDKTAIELKLIPSKAELFNYFDSQIQPSQKTPSYYYYSGALQLFVIQSLKSDYLTKKNPLLGKDNLSSENIFAHLKKLSSQAQNL